MKEAGYALTTVCYRQSGILLFFIFYIEDILCESSYKKEFSKRTCNVLCFVSLEHILRPELLRSCVLLECFDETLFLG